eukprot:6304791-Prymnesium_polylepis.1
MQAEEEPPLRVLVPVATGSEEIETACITDTLVRAGASVTVASVMAGDSLEITMSRGLKIVADCSIDDCVDQEWAAIGVCFWTRWPYRLTLQRRALSCLRECAALPRARAIALPGGMPGAEHLRDSAPLLTLLSRQASEGRLLGAVCASPAV